MGEVRDQITKENQGFGSLPSFSTMGITVNFFGKITLAAMWRLDQKRTRKDLINPLGGSNSRSRKM